MQEKLLGIILIATSGVIFTLERVAATLTWGLIVAGVNARGSGDYPSQPLMPGIADNSFVLFFLVAGLVLFLVGLIKRDRPHER